MQLFLLLLSVLLPLGSTDESFHEELLLTPLPSGHLLASFQFTTLAPTIDTRRHFNYLPRSFFEILEYNSVRELDVALTRGVWRSQLWGYNSPNPQPPGAFVGAWFNQDVEDVSDKWHQLTNALSGQLCASLNFLDATQAMQPKHSFQPSGVTATAWTNTTSFRYGTLPGENVCTENLTPWKKLLPCQAKRGLATMLNSVHVHRTTYHSLGLSYRTVCDDVKGCTRPLIEFKQYVTLVFDPIAVDYHWSINQLFGIGILSSCPMATTSAIYIETSRGDFTLKPEGVGKVVTKDTKTFAVYNVTELVDRGISNLMAAYKKSTVFGIIPPPTLHATRYLVGHGQERGGIVTKLHNHHSKELSVVYLDVVPWFLRLYLHTLKVTTDDGVSIEPALIEFEPGRDRERPYLLELVLKLPPKSVTKISIDFEHSLLKWLEYPPDANKGFYVGSAIISALLPTSANHTFSLRETSTIAQAFEFSRAVQLTRIFTEVLLVSLPTPDFSMPYNVICLACTVVALAFGPLHNITTKSLSLVPVEEKQTLKQRIKSFFTKKESKEEERTVEDEEDKKDK